MTQIFPRDIECSACGEKSTHYSLMSTNSMGYSDLDTRPPEMMRSTMNQWVQECPHCGYVSSSLEDELEIPKEYLKSDEYLTCSNISFESDLSKRFYRCYLIDLKNNDLFKAFYHILYCAWACDDANDKNAVASRKIAIELADRLVESDIEEKETIQVIKSDLLRRSGEFEEVINQYCNIRFDEEILNEVVRFEIEKAKEKDDSCYTMEEIYG